jgi:hypothetical protein
MTVFFSISRRRENNASGKEVSVKLNVDKDGD